MSVPTLSTIIESGLLLACSLAWSDTVRLMIKEFYPDKTEAVLVSQIIYTIVLTLTVIILVRQLKQLNL